MSTSTESLTGGPAAGWPTGSRHHLVAGSATLLAGIVLAAGLIFGLTAGVGAVWTSVTSTSSGSGTSGMSGMSSGTSSGMGAGAAMSGTSSGMGAGAGSASVPGAGSGVAPGAQHVTLVVDPQPLGGVKGPDGHVHDAFVPATFTMKAGATVVVSVTNYDPMPHTWTAPGLGVNAMVPAGSKSSPSHATFTIHPTKAGTFTWYCATPCDPFAMRTDGLMRGHVTVVA